ncbi:MAG: META domain-containing protein [Rhodobacteraceae bacterium]|nr:META domain-containing protein [Paracoccaceae bacterium]
MSAMTFSGRWPAATAAVAVALGLGLALGIAATTELKAEAHMDPYADPDTTWVLETLNEAPFEAPVTMTFPEPGRIAGKATCNTYAGPMEATFPDFQTGMLMTTRMACPEMDLERSFLTTLATMTEAEVTDSALVLSNGKGGQMVFVKGE